MGLGAFSQFPFRLAHSANCVHCFWDMLLKWALLVWNTLLIFRVVLGIVFGDIRRDRKLHPHLRVFSIFVLLAVCRTHHDLRGVYGGKVEHLECNFIHFD